MIELVFQAEPRDGESAHVLVAAEHVLLVGYTGRDRAKVMEHIHELAQVGVAPPPQVPMIYTVPPRLLTTGSSIDVRGAETSGEAEVYFLHSDRGLLVGVGSDHTDRKAEAIDVAHSKGLCAKVLSPEVWFYDELADGWDALELRSWVTDSAGRRLYQEGTLVEFMPLTKLLDEVRAAGHHALSHTVIFGGTLPIIGGFAYASRFEAELRDPVSGRSLRAAYDIHVGKV